MMIKEAIIRLFFGRVKSVYSQIEDVLKEAEACYIMEEFWPAADLAQFAMDEADLTGNKEFADQIRERALGYQFGSYDPLDSKISFVKSRAYDRAKREESVKKIDGLEKVAEKALKKSGIEGVEKAKESYFEAIEEAKDLNDSELVEELKTRFKKVADKYVKKLVQ